LDLVVHAATHSAAATSIGAGFSFSGISVTRHSVVSYRPAIDTAFCRAMRVTFSEYPGAIYHVMSRGVRPSQL
jgi:hypothetical protein